MKCKKCGQENSDIMLFCINCGEQLDKNDLFDTNTNDLNNNSSLYDNKIDDFVNETKIEIEPIEEIKIDDVKIESVDDISLDEINAENEKLIYDLKNDNEELISEVKNEEIIEEPKKIEPTIINEEPKKIEPVKVEKEKTIFEKLDEAESKSKTTRIETTNINPNNRKVVGLISKPNPILTVIVSTLAIFLIVIIIMFNSFKSVPVGAAIVTIFVFIVIAAIIGGFLALSVVSDRNDYQGRKALKNGEIMEAKVTYIHKNDDSYYVGFAYILRGTVWETRQKVTKRTFNKYKVGDTIYIKANDVIGVIDESNLG